ncbi:MAG: rhodanese-like domain-containing protein [Crocinitomicaceae bacterium]|nr:rhodanese-like domain-containing protein [Crocinitomicaceae bacterium]
MYKSFFLLIALFTISISFAQDDTLQEDTIIRDASFADYDAFRSLVNTVESYRAERMISLEEMKSMSKNPNTIILDTRSKEMYDAKHVKGAIHLNFADFTQATLSKILPTLDMNVIIYCNNNFVDDQIYFATKFSAPDPIYTAQSLGITMALNIPTYINLYGYGYRNIYELKDLISVFDNSITFEGTSVASVVTLEGTR